MRPTRLQVKGFTCFKDEQIIDLSGLRLFAVIGPTGAGKSTLLDAIVFALYGYVPRVGKGFQELISLGRDQLSVVLDFELGARTFRITRLARRNRGGDAILEELTDGGMEPISGVRAVDAEVEKQLGLGYNAFVQSIVLPQNQFAQFLKGDPKDQRKILQELLHHEIYERMRLRASRKKEVLGERLRLAKRRQEEYASDTAEHLASLETKAEGHSKSAAALEASIAEKQRELETLTALAALCKELAGKRAEIDRMAKDESLLAAEESKAKQARKALRVLPLILQADEASESAAHAAKESTLAEAALAVAQQRTLETRRTLDSSIQAASRIPALRDRIAALDALRGTETHLAELRARLLKLESEAKPLSKELERVRREALETKAGSAAADKTLQASEAALRDVGFDVVGYDKLENLRDEITELVQERKDAAISAEETDEAQRAATGAKKRAIDAQLAAEKAKELASEANEKATLAATVLDDAKRLHSAALLRESIDKGEPCPVCEQLIEKMPKKARPPNLDALINKSDAADEARDRAKEAASAARTEARNAVKHAAEASAKHEESAAASKTRAAALDTRARKLERNLRLHLEDDDRFIEVRAAERLRLSTARKKLHDAQEKKVNQARSDRDRALHLYEKCDSALKELERRVLENTSALDEALAREKSLVAELHAVTRDPQPSAERARVASQVAQLDAALKEAEAASARASSDEAAKSATAAERRSRTAELERTGVEATAEALAAARALGFIDASAVHSAVLDEREIEASESRLEVHRQKLVALKARSTELEQLTAGRRATDNDVQNASDVLRESREDREATLRAIATLEQQIRNCAERIREAEEVNKEIVEVDREHGLFHQLASDLRSDRFQQYALQEFYLDLVRGASTRLFELSAGRYGFDFKDSRFFVVDHDNAKQTRSTDTLSGGETFLASLALAMELSAQVQRAAGAAVLDSLFIDEGFGSLDPETLETVAGAIESLPSGRRMVGIVTHVSDLADRLPARVRVERKSEGSRVQVDRE